MNLVPKIRRKSNPAYIFSDYGSKINVLTLSHCPVFFIYSVILSLSTFFHSLLVVLFISFLDENFIMSSHWIISYHTKTLERKSSYFPMPFSNICFALVTISLLLYTWISLILLLWIFFLLFLCYSTVLKHMAFKHNFIFRILILEPSFLFKQLVHSA